MSSAGLYIHIPFCKKKCLYCDFCSFEGSNHTLHIRYLKSLQKEMDFCSETSISTVYIGGGTPTLLSKSSLSRLMDAIDSLSIRSGSCPVECTIEANPGTADFYKLKLLRDRGINRLSIGAQSFNDAELTGLGRIHDSEDIYRVYESAIKAGFSNINLDLIFGLPGQSPEDWADSLKKAVKLRPRHISAYNLQLEKGTPMHDRFSGSADMPDNDTEYRMYKGTIEFLKSEGYIHYEVSNFCLPGFECRHNVNYWENGEYIGIGVSACSHTGGGRKTNTSDLKKYLEDPVRSGKKEKRTRNNEISETMFMGLRMLRGISERAFKDRFGRPLKEMFGKEIKKLAGEDLVEARSGRLRLTEKGLFVSNEVFEMFV